MGPERRRALVLVVAVTLVGCRGGKVSWPQPEGEVAARHAEVKTVNAGYQRTKSQVLVREIARPTRANLDWAAYHANFMNADPAPEGGGEGGAVKVPAKPFKGTLEPGTLTSTITRTPLTEAERARPLAIAPLVEWLGTRKPPLGEGLEEVVSAVRAETWGLGGSAAQPRQLATDAFLHAPEGGEDAVELWVKLEMQPWFRGLGDLPDEDGDGVPEVYGRVRADLVKPEVVAAIRADYAGKVMTPAEVRAWANQLSSYWYPSYNTDLVTPPQTWPDSETEDAIRKELGGASFAAPAVVMRGKPHGTASYNVFLVKGGAAGEEKTTSLGTTPALPRTKLSAQPKKVMDAVKAELAGRPRASWSAWAASLEPFYGTVRSRMRSAPAQVKGLPGQAGFLFFRNEMEYVVGGDLEKQPRGKNPLPVIIEFKNALAARGVDFLFVPVPNKLEVFPDKLDGRHKALVGQVVNPFERKLLLSLGAGGVEVVDLLPPFLDGRSQEPRAGRELLYQAQDTHWSHRGLELAARVVAQRIKEYPWYAELAKRGRRYQIKETTFTRHGDLHSRLAEPLKKQYKPETLLGRQVLNPDGSPYEDDADSPIVLLGDSFTGVYQLTDCQHAGVSAHIAKEIGYPVDLVMSYGGGPNVRQKLLRRGMDDLSRKRLVIWMMTARDLYKYWEDWAPLKAARGQ